MHQARLMLLIGLTAAVAACARAPGQSAEFYVFGTLVNVSLPNAEAGQAPPTFAALQQAFQRMHREWHPWEPGELTRLNTSLQAGETATASSDILTLIRRSQSLERLSGGRFNPAIGKVIALWGFHTSDFPLTGPPPLDSEIRALVAARPSSLNLVLEDGTVRSKNPAVQLDFGGIAKGYATDLACALLRDSGYVDAIVNAGGDMRAMGDNRGRPWRIAVRYPISAGGSAGGIAGTIEVSGDIAVFTSGNYERFREDAGERYPHILDPRTGLPVRDISSATVIAKDGTTADAAATALVVAGPEEWPKVAADMGIEAALVIDQSGKMRATREMMDYFTPAEGKNIMVVDTD